VIDRALGENAARRQPGMPGADDDDGEAIDSGVRQTISTVTSVGLVIAS
jgi:hypothetical protein